VIRNLSLFNLAIDSKLRGCDVVAIKVDEIAAKRLCSRSRDCPSEEDRQARQVRIDRSNSAMGLASRDFRHGSIRDRVGQRQFRAIVCYAPIATKFRVETKWRDGRAVLALCDTRLQKEIRAGFDH
jgi:hypothetical protein